MKTSSLNNKTFTNHPFSLKSAPYATEFLVPLHPHESIQGITMNKQILALTVATLLAAPAFAQAADNADDHWSGTGEVGLAIAKGNTDSRTLVGKLAAARKQGDWTYAAGAAFLNGKADGKENAYRYEAFGTAARDLNAQSYIGAGIRTERDHYASYEYQNVAAANYGFRAVDNETTKLTLEVGAGYRWSKLQDLRVHENGVIARGALLFKHQFNENVGLYNDLLLEGNKDNIFIRNDIGVLVKMTDALALKAGVETRHNTDVLPGVKKTDTLTTVNVVYGF
ncbi:hypothetical protein CO613_04775 [Lysobacteraceae bacterium NML07-0707]|nr:hypothetical protein CO613_04775 [Xanthomonadaceae bacterium NML07-0707]